MKPIIFDNRLQFSQGLAIGKNRYSLFAVQDEKDTDFYTFQHIIRSAVCQEDPHKIVSPDFIAETKDCQKSRADKTKAVNLYEQGMKRLYDLPDARTGFMAETDRTGLAVTYTFDAFDYAIKSVTINPVMARIGEMLSFDAANALFAQDEPDDQLFLMNRFIDAQRAILPKDTTVDNNLQKTNHHNFQTLVQGAEALTQKTLRQACLQQNLDVLMRVNKNDMAEANVKPLPYNYATTTDIRRLCVKQDFYKTPVALHATDAGLINTSILHGFCADGDNPFSTRQVAHVAVLEHARCTMQ